MTYKKNLAALTIAIALVSGPAVADGVWDQIEGNWKQFSGGVQEKWGELTDDDTAELTGEREQLIGKIQEKYGIAKEEAEAQVDEWSESLGLDS